jgi:hypothetical protein
MAPFEEQVGAKPALKRICRECFDYHSHASPDGHKVDTKDAMPKAKSGTIEIKDIQTSEASKSCHVEVGNGLLRIFKQKGQKKPIYDLNLAECELLTDLAHASITLEENKFGFVLRASTVSLLLSCDTEQEMTNWILHICEALNRTTLDLWND